MAGRNSSIQLRLIWVLETNNEWRGYWIDCAVCYKSEEDYVNQMNIDVLQLIYVKLN